jgi:Flp pilus assembly pilin Flp
VAEALRDHKGTAATELAVLLTAVGTLNLFELLEL